jgi:uncharacterized protein (DUF885 family)
MSPLPELSDWSPDDLNVQAAVSQPTGRGRILDMADTMPKSADPGRRVRDVADAFVHDLAELDPIVATALGLPVGQDRLPDFSPTGEAARDDLRRTALGRLAGAEQAADEAGGFASADERRCARLLRERLETQLAVGETGEHLRSVSNFLAAPNRVREAFTLMPAQTADDWAVAGARMARVPDALAGYRAALAEGASLDMYPAPRLISALAEQLNAWQANGTGWFAGFSAPAQGPASLRADLDRASAAADAAVGGLREWLLSDYLPGAAGTPDGVGADRYALAVRRWNGAQPGLTETYEWGWAQFREIRAEIAAEADRIQPGATVQAAFAHLDQHGEVVEGVEEVRLRLQELLDEAVADLNGTHFDLADPVKMVEARIAPPGSAAAPYYTEPSQDFSRPGRTWLPTLGRTRFPMWHLYTTWYHEGVPGHHLQLAQWCYLSGQLSAYQTTVGDVSACTEGWGLYAERLMDELGYLEAPGARLGYLVAQLTRAVRVIIDIGMHLELTVPADSPMFAGEVWTPERALEFFMAQLGRDRKYSESEVIRYLGLPAQAISYKLGERAWLAGRDAARAARGSSFDLKAWHMSALSLGSLGLDDLADELAHL